MSIKFECACGHRMKAPDGSEGRWVRCSLCRTKVAVPGGEPGNDAGGAGFESEVSSALAQQEAVSRRRSRARSARRLSPRVEEWLMEHGLWRPAGIAIMSLFGLLGAACLAAGLYTLFQVCGFLFLIGLGLFVFGRMEEPKENPE